MKQAGSAIYSQGQGSSTGATAQEAEPKDENAPYERVVDADYHESN
jgi:hypothetical protein